MTTGRWSSAAKRFAPAGAATIVVGLLAALFSPAAEAGRPEPADRPLAAMPASYAAAGSELFDVLPAVVSPVAAAPAAPVVVAAVAAPAAAPVVVSAAAQPPGTDAAMFTSDAPDARVRSAIGFALEQLGLPYVWGGNGPAAGDSGFDCSGLTTASYAAAGIGLPRTAQTQYYAGPHVPPTAGLLPGDLVFYGVPGLVHHVGMYLGAGKMINAPTFGEPVQVAYVRYPGDDYLGATRPAYGGALVPGYLPAIPPPGAGSAPRTPSPIFEAPAAPAPTQAEIQADVAAATAPVTGIEAARTVAPVDLAALVPGTAPSVVVPDAPVTPTPVTPTPADSVPPLAPAPSTVAEPPPTSTPLASTPAPGAADPVAPPAPVVDPLSEPPVPVSPLPSESASPAPVPTSPAPVAAVPSTPAPAPAVPAPPAPAPPAPVEQPAPVPPPAPAQPKPAPKPEPEPVPVVTPAPIPPRVPAEPVPTTTPPKPVPTTTTAVPTTDVDAPEADG